MTHAKIGSRIVTTGTLCRLLGITEKQLRQAERDGAVHHISEREWFNTAYQRMEKAAAELYAAGRRERFTDSELRELWNQTVARMETEEAEIFTAEVSSAELADVLGVTDRWVRQLAEDGLLPRNESGQYPFAHALACYFNWRAGRR
jgi:hypothetical protein